MHNPIRFLALILILGNHCANPMLLAKRLKQGIASLARVRASKGIALAASASKARAESARKAYNHFVPVRCMGITAYNQVVRNVHKKCTAPTTQCKMNCAMPACDMSISAHAKAFKFLGSSLDNVLNEGPVTYTIGEYEFIDLCVHASKAKSVDQKPLYELIQRITQGKKAERLIKYFSYDESTGGNGVIQRCGWTSKFNYGGEINLTGAELARCLFNYIQYKGSLEAGPSGNGTTALRVEVFVNGELRQLMCAPKTKQMRKVDRAAGCVLNWGVEIKGQKEIRLGMGFHDVASPEVLKKFNELVEKAQKTDK